LINHYAEQRERSLQRMIKICSWSNILCTKPATATIKNWGIGGLL
jgi:hypothetical protein